MERAPTDSKIEMFKECFKRFQHWLPYQELPPRGTQEFDLATTLPHDFKRPTWLVGIWFDYEIMNANLSPIHWEPLRLQDLYRCPKALLECDKEYMHFEDKRRKVCRICEDEEESEHTVNYNTYLTICQISFMWLFRHKILTRRLQGAQVMFPVHIRPECVQEYKLTLVQALHPRIIALGTCKLSLLSSDLLQRIFALSVDGA